MQISGDYHGMNYTVRYVESGLAGAYYEVLLTIGKKQSLEMASTFAGAFVKLAERIRAWDLEQKDIIMTGRAGCKANW